MSGGLRSPAQAHLNQLFHGSEELDDDLTSVWPPPDQGSTLSSPAGEPGPPGDQAGAKIKVLQAHLVPDLSGSEGVE